MSKCILKVGGLNLTRTLNFFPFEKCSGFFMKICRGSDQLEMVAQMLVVQVLQLRRGRPHQLADTAFENKFSEIQILEIQNLRKHLVQLVYLEKLMKLFFK